METDYIHPIAFDGRKERDARAERRSKDIVFYSALRLGVNLMHAKDGATIAREHLDRLYLHGESDYSSHVVLASYYDDMDDYNALVQKAYQEEKQKTEDQHNSLLLELQNADLPPILFKRVTFQANATNPKVRTYKSGIKAVVSDLGIVGTEDIDEAEKVRRYAKYTLAQELLSDRDISETRLAGIVMGIHLNENATQGRVTSSYQSEIYKASNNTVSQADVELSAELRGHFDIIFPTHREKYLANLGKLSDTPVVLPLSSPERIMDMKAEDLYINPERLVLELGAVAIANAKPKYTLLVNLLSQLPSPDSSAITNKKNKRRREKYKHWDSDMCIVYGRWILQIMQSSGNNIDRSHLRHASKLNIGPGIKIIMSRTGTNSVSEYFKLVGTPPRRNPKDFYADWTQDDYVSLARLIASENDGVVTKSIIRQRIKDGKEEPGPGYYERVGGYSFILKEAGLKVHNEPLNRGKIMDLCLKYYKATGEIPKRPDFLNSPDLPSDFAVSKHFGGIKNLQNEMLELILSGDFASEQAA